MERSERTSTNEESQKQVDEEVEQKTQEEVDSTQQKPSSPNPNTLGFMQSEQYPWNANTPWAQYEQYMQTPKMFSDVYASAFYYKIASSKCRKSSSTKCVIGHPNVFKDVDARLKANQSKGPATVPKSVSESLKEPVTSSKSFSGSVKDPVTTSKSIFESLKEPVTISKSVSVGMNEPGTSSKSFTESMKEPVTTSKSISAGMKEPVTSSKSSSKSMKDPMTTSKSISVGMKEPAISSKSSSESMKDPVTTSKSISEGMKEPGTTCLSESTSEFFNNAHVAMLNKAINFLDTYLVHHYAIRNFSTPSTLHELVEIFKRKLVSYVIILTESMVTNMRLKRENLQLYHSLIRESSLVMREEHLDGQRNFHDVKVEFVRSLIRLKTVLLPEEVKELCSLVYAELKPTQEHVMEATKVL